MITDAILSALAGIVTWVLGLFPTVSPPAFLTTTIPNLVGQLSSYLDGTAVWLPWSALTTSAVFVLLVLGVTVAIKGVRIVASFMTAGGGSAG